MASQILSIGKLPRCAEVREDQEDGRILRRIPDDKRAKSASELRHEVGAKTETLDFLSQEQQDILEVILGEVLTNACCCAADAPVKIAWESSSSGFRLSIANKSKDCFEGRAVLPEDCLSEHGRGLVLIEKLAEDLKNNAGLHVGCRLCQHPNRIVFQITIGK